MDIAQIRRLKIDSRSSINKLLKVFFPTHCSEKRPEVALLGFGLKLCDGLILFLSPQFKEKEKKKKNSYTLENL